MTPDLLRRLKAHKAELLAMAIIQQTRDLGNVDLADALAEAWDEGISIITADKIPLAEAQATALQQLLERGLIKQCPLSQKGPENAAPLERDAEKKESA